MPHRPRPPNMAHVRAFVEVADTGSITRAAPRLGYSQPGLGQRLQAFEWALGARLLDRGPQGVELTAAGVIVLAHARELLCITDRLRERISQYQAVESQPPAPEATTGEARSEHPEGASGVQRDDD
jgi:DNA-binding transcriptional LysR family regulator